MTQHRVYEKRGDEIQSWIGEVEADHRKDAIEKAHKQYGAPITVKEE